jgi:hypothetical protein
VALSEEFDLLPLVGRVSDCIECLDSLEYEIGG